MNLFKKLFCLHKWETHAKKEYQWEEHIKGTWGKFEKVSETTEILICEECGKIEKIKY